MLYKQDLVECALHCREQILDQCKELAEMLEYTWNDKRQTNVHMYFVYQKMDNQLDETNKQDWKVRFLAI